jgi:hypothetical protein
MISLIVVTYNSAHLLPAFARALATDTVAPAYELIIVDNASHDAPWQVLPDAHWVRLPSNVGFGTACNHGVAHATGDYFVSIPMYMSPQAGSPTCTPTWSHTLTSHSSPPKPCIPMNSAFCNQASQIARLCPAPH